MSNLAFNIFERGENEKAKTLRKNGENPCVIYGDGIKDSLSTNIQKYVLLKLMNCNTTSSLIPLNLNGNTKTCVVKSIEKDVFGKVIHVDFQSVNKNDVIRLKLPINFINEESLENKRLVLETFNAEIEIQGIASEMPETIEVNLEGLNFEDKIFAKDIKLPQNIDLITDPETLLAIVAGSDNNNDDEENEENKENLIIE